MDTPAIFKCDFIHNMDREPISGIGTSSEILG